MPPSQLRNLPPDRRATLERYRDSIADTAAYKWTTRDSAAAFSQGMRDGLAGAGKGVGNSLSGTARGIAEVAQHPLKTSRDTLAAMYEVANHPLLATTAAGKAARQSYDQLAEAIRSGDSAKAGELTGKFFGDVTQSAAGASVAARVSTATKTLSTIAKEQHVDAPAPSLSRSDLSTRHVPRMARRENWLALDADAPEGGIVPFRVARIEVISKSDVEKAAAYFGERAVRHHLFTKTAEIQNLLRGAGIRRDDYVMLISESAHNRAIYGVHATGKSARGKQWDDEWTDFARKHPNASKEQLISKAESMIAQFGLYGQE